MTLPAYPGRDTPASYVGAHVPAECPECGHIMYVPPVSFDGKERRCNGCETIQTLTFWREESA
jgi:Zn ribbon nucleic-acid-binding protein